MSDYRHDNPMMRILLAISFGVPLVVIALLIWWLS